MKTGVRKLSLAVHFLLFSHIALNTCCSISSVISNLKGIIFKVVYDLMMRHLLGILNFFVALSMRYFK